MPLKIAPKIDRVDKDFFESEIAPLLHNSLLEFVGEIGDGEKDEFLAIRMHCCFRSTGRSRSGW
jgi:hypothetical protein